MPDIIQRGMRSLLTRVQGRQRNRCEPSSTQGRNGAAFLMRIGK